VRFLVDSAGSHPRTLPEALLSAGQVGGIPSILSDFLAKRSLLRWFTSEKNTAFILQKYNKCLNHRQRLH